VSSIGLDEIELFTVVRFMNWTLVNNLVLFVFTLTVFCSLCSVVSSFLLKVV